MQIHTQIEESALNFCKACGMPMFGLKNSEKYTGDSLEEFCSSICAGAHQRGRYEAI